MTKSRITILKAFIKKEILQVLRDRRMRIVLIVAPLIQLLIFGVAISSETRNVKLAVYSRQNDIGMHDLFTRSLGTKWFVPAKVSGSDPFEWVRSGEAEAVLVAPLEGTGRGAERGRGKIQLLINAQNSNRARSIEMYLKAINREVFSNKSYAAATGLAFEIRALYNPSADTSMFMVPGVLSMLICLVTIMLTSMAVSREIEAGTIETLTSAPLDTWDLMLGKTVPFIIIGSIQTPLILAFAVIVFGLPVRGPLFMLIIASLLIITATTAIGLLVSTISKNQQKAMMGGFMYLFPSYLLSGLMFPTENMPSYFQPFVFLNPLAHYMGLLRNILLMGGNLNYFLIHSSILFGIALLISVLAFQRFKIMLNHS